MYVLQHADRPELYHGLPDDPQHQSDGVACGRAWPSRSALAVMALAALAGLLPLHRASVRTRCRGRRGRGRQAKPKKHAVRGRYAMNTLSTPTGAT